MLQVTFGLLLVLGMIGGLAWAVARLGRLRPASNATVRVVAAASVGPRERVAVVEVAGQWLVLGVAPGSVNLLDKTVPPATGALDATGAMSTLSTMSTIGAIGAVGLNADAPASSAAASALPPLPPFAAWLQRALSRGQGS